uniref:P47 n=1 Tax=Nesodiprion zhejiangensis nucleopolyhedrovirus TaxID=3135970 RepID=A0AAN0LMD6_9BACU
MFRNTYICVMKNLPRNCIHLSTILSKYNIFLNHRIYYHVQNDVITNSYVWKKNNTFDLHTTMIRYNLELWTRQESFILMEKFIDELIGRNLSNHDKMLLKLFIRFDWNGNNLYHHHILELYKRDKLHLFCKYLCNVMFERGYEDKYPFGQQLSISITTNKMQEGLNFKHTIDNTQIANSWKGDKIDFITKPYTLMQILEFNKFKYNFTFFEIKTKKIWTILENKWPTKFYTDWHNNTIVALEFNNTAEQNEQIEYLKDYFDDEQINLLMMTNIDRFTSFREYFYFGLKIFYYLVTRKYYFHCDDHTTIVFLSVIIILRYRNNGSLASFDSNVHPLASYSRRQAWLKKAANINMTLQNDSNLKLDFLKGNRLNLGAGNNDMVVKIGI